MPSAVPGNGPAALSSRDPVAYAAALKALG